MPAALQIWPCCCSSICIPSSSPDIKERNRTDNAIRRETVPSAWASLRLQLNARDGKRMHAGRECGRGGQGCAACLVGGSVGMYTAGFRLTKPVGCLTNLTRNPKASDWFAHRLRQLVRRLEVSVGVRPWPKPLKGPHQDAGPLSHRTLYYMGLKKRCTQMTANTLSRATNASVNLNGPVNEFRHLVMSWDDWQEGMDVVVRHLKQKDLPAFVFPEGQPSSSSHHFKCCTMLLQHCMWLTIACSILLFHSKATVIVQTACAFVLLVCACHSTKHVPSLHYYIA